MPASEQKTRRGVGVWFIAFMVVILVIGIFPWLAAALFTPLQPPQFAETPTAYILTSAAIRTERAIIERGTPEP